MGSSDAAEIARCHGDVLRLGTAAAAATPCKAFAQVSFSDRVEVTFEH